MEVEKGKDEQLLKKHMNYLTIDHNEQLDSDCPRVILDYVLWKKDKVV